MLHMMGMTFELKHANMLITHYTETAHVTECKFTQKAV